MKHVKLFEDHRVDEVTTLEIWKAVDKAQLDEYEKTGPKELTIGDMEYNINKYWMNENDVPSLELVNKKTNSVHYVHLSLVWSGYVNWSALGAKEREELRQKYLS